MDVTSNRGGDAQDAAAEDAAGGGCRAGPPWVVAVIGLTVSALILLLAFAAAYGAGTLFDASVDLSRPRSYRAGELEDLTTIRLAAFLGVFQIATTLLTIGAAALLYRRAGPLVRYGWPVGGARTIAAAFGCLLLIAAAYAIVIYNVDRQAFLHDIGPFAQLMQTHSWWLLLIAAGVGAPIAEETLFRGFLYGTLKGTAAGRPAAALATSAMWASLHANYSGYGLAAITLIGLYLAYLRDRTQSLAAPILCHAAYNSAIVLALAFMVHPA